MANDRVSGISVVDNHIFSEGSRMSKVWVVVFIATNVITLSKRSRIIIV